MTDSPPLTAEDATHKALLMLLQKEPRAMAAAQFIRWLEQDGFTVATRAKASGEGLHFHDLSRSGVVYGECPASGEGRAQGETGLRRWSQGHTGMEEDDEGPYVLFDDMADPAPAGLDEYDPCQRTHAPGTTHYHPLRTKR